MSSHPSPLKGEGRVRGVVVSAKEMAPRAGLEPATPRLTAGCSTIELSGNAESNCGRKSFVSQRPWSRQAACLYVHHPSLSQLSPPRSRRAPRLERRPSPLRGEGCNSRDVAAAFEGLGEGDFVSVFEVAADGQAARDASDTHAERLEQLGEIDGRGFALHARIGGEDDLFHPRLFETHQKLAHAEVLGADAVERRERAEEDVVAATELAGTLEGEKIVGLLHHAQRARVTPRIAADAAVHDELLELGQ